MQATINTQPSLLQGLKADLLKVNNFLYGTKERAQRSVSLSFLALVLLQVFGLISQHGATCGL